MSERGLHVRVKSARGRSQSSTKWLTRQLNDPYVRRTKAEGYRSRSAFKLVEIDKKFGILKNGMRVVDLGSAPGGWSEVATKCVQSSIENPLIVAVDYQEMQAIPGVKFIHKDFLDDDAPKLIMDALDGNKANLVLSDMAAPTTGHKKTDHLRTIHLFEVAADFARSSLTNGGTFLAKVFIGGTENELLALLKREYQSVKHIKPPASRKESPEMYVLASGYRGT